MTVSRPKRGLCVCVCVCVQRNEERRMDQSSKIRMYISSVHTVYCASMYLQTSQVHHNIHMCTYTLYICMYMYECTFIQIRKYVHTPI